MWLLHRALEKCQGNQIVTRLSPVTLPLTTVKTIHTLTPEKSPELAYIFKEPGLWLQEGVSQGSHPSSHCMLTCHIQTEARRILTVNVHLK